MIVVCSNSRFVEKFMNFSCCRFVHSHSTLKIFERIVVSLIKMTRIKFAFRFFQKQSIMIFSSLIFASCSKLIFLEKYWLKISCSSKRNMSFFAFFKNANLFDLYSRRSSSSQTLKFSFISLRIVWERELCHSRINSKKHINKIHNTEFDSFNFAMCWNLLMKNAIVCFFELKIMIFAKRNFDLICFWIWYARNREFLFS